jgi:predicted RNA-binding protein with TRAM domain
MVEIPDELRSVFSATVRERDGEHVLTIPESELTHEAVTAGETYRIAVLETRTTGASDTEPTRDADRTPQPGPPVEEGEVREVTVEAVGDQGDGIAKVERGYVVIVPDGRPGQQPTVEIDEVRKNVAFATIVGPDSRA